MLEKTVPLMLPKEIKEVKERWIPYFDEIFVNEKSQKFIKMLFIT
jgi:hypothetical protein